MKRDTCSSLTVKKVKPLLNINLLLFDLGVIISFILKWLISKISYWSEVPFRCLDLKTNKQKTKQNKIHFPIPTLAFKVCFHLNCKYDICKTKVDYIISFDIKWFVISTHKFKVKGFQIKSRGKQQSSNIFKWFLYCLFFFNWT